MRKRIYYGISLALAGLVIGMCVPGFRVWASGIAQGAYNTVENAGSALTQRAVLNMTGSGVSCADNSMSLRTDCTIPGGGGSSGGVNLQTANYTLQSTDSGLTVVMNCSSSCTVTMYGSPSSTFTACIISIGSSLAAVSLNSLDYNGGASAPVLITGQEICFASNGTNYFGATPSVAGSNVTLTGAANGTTYAASGGGGGSTTAAPPYLEISSTFYDSDFYAVTKPVSSPTFINSSTPSITNTAGTNGDWVATTESATVSWQEQTCTTSVETVFRTSAYGSTSTDTGVWIYDSTNGHIWEWYVTGGNTSVVPSLALNEWNYSGSGAPSFNNNVAKWGSPIPFGQAHFRIVKSGSTASFQVSHNGGQNFYTYATESVGTLADCGWDIASASSTFVTIDVLSQVVN